MKIIDTNMCWPDRISRPVDLLSISVLTISLKSAIGCREFWTKFCYKVSWWYYWDRSEFWKHVFNKSRAVSKVGLPNIGLPTTNWSKWLWNIKWKHMKIILWKAFLTTSQSCCILLVLNFLKKNCREERKKNSYTNWFRQHFPWQDHLIEWKHDWVRVK